MMNTLRMRLAGDNNDPVWKEPVSSDILKRAARALEAERAKREAPQAIAVQPDIP